MAYSPTESEFETEVVHPHELSDDDVGAWLRLQSVEPAYGNPLLGPAFARAVGAVRGDARVAVYRRAGRAIGFLPYHRRPGGFTRPIGAPFCDYHALVSAADAGLGSAAALESADIGALRLSGLIDPNSTFEEAITTRAWAHRIVIRTTAENYLDELWRTSANRRKNYRRYHRSLERTFGPARIVSPDPDPAVLDRLIDWKRIQLRRTGVHDFLSVGWVQTLMRRLGETSDGEFKGLMVSLYAGQRLVAAQFGVRQGGWFHPWIGAFDPDLAEHSPGFVHQVEAIAAMPGLGLTTYDLGPGSDHWKRMFAQDGVWIGAGLATGASAAGVIARSCEGVWNASMFARAPLVGRARNRMDQIAALELTMSGRLRGAASAVATFRSTRRELVAPRLPLPERRETWIPS